MDNNEPAIPDDNLLNEIKLFNEVAAIIERCKFRAQAHVNQESVRIGSVLLNGERAKYGKQIVATLSQQLKEKYGSSFDYSNVTRMIKFAARFPDVQIVVPLAQQSYAPKQAATKLN